MKENHIEELLHDFELINYELTEIMVYLRNKILSSSHILTEDIKYGGIVFLKNGHMLSGIFLRKKFVTMEFGFGYEFVDEDNLLEGTGKFRRNLKFKTMEDVERKRAEYFIEQAVNKQFN